MSDRLVTDLDDPDKCACPRDAFFSCHFRATGDDGLCDHCRANAHHTGQEPVPCT